MGKIILIRIENERKTDKNTNAEFLLKLEQTLLLHLKERRFLNEMQYRNAEIKLRAQNLISDKGVK